MGKQTKTWNVSKIAKKYGTLIGYVILLIAFTVLAPGKFMTMKNMIGILRQIAMLGTISIGLTFVMITKRSDLSIGYSTSFLGIFVAALIVHGGMNICRTLSALLASATWWPASIRLTPRAIRSPTCRRPSSCSAPTGSPTSCPTRF